MTVPPAPPKTYARAKRAQTDEYALPSFRACHSVAHLRAAVAAEAERSEPRRERIAVANQRIQRLKEIDTDQRSVNE